QREPTMRFALLSSPPLADRVGGHTFQFAFDCRDAVYRPLPALKILTPADGCRQIHLFLCRPACNNLVLHSTPSPGQSRAVPVLLRSDVLIQYIDALEQCRKRKRNGSCCRQDFPQHLTKLERSLFHGLSIAETGFGIGD